MSEERGRQELRLILRLGPTERKLRRYAKRGPAKVRQRQSQSASGYGFSLASGDFAAGTLQPRTDSSPRFPAVKRLDSRTRVRRPSITAGMGSCVTPRITKIIKAASPGESALEVMPTP